MVWLLVTTLALAETGLEDTASLGDTAEDTDTASDSGDTASDSGDTADSSDSASSSDTSTTTTDTGDTGYTVTAASSLANEKGGFGCASVGVGGVLALWLSSFVIGLRRRDPADE